MQPHFNSITAAGFTYQQGGFVLPPCNLHWKDPNGHWNFWCPVTSVTSGSSSSPRTELRETEADTSDSFNWRPTDFRVNRMEGVAVIRKVPSSQKVIFAQVHAQGATKPFVKLLQFGRELRAEVRLRPGDAANLVAIRLPLGSKRASYRIEVRDGELIIVLNGQLWARPVDEAWNWHLLYFKAGAYVIDNVGPETEGGWVVYERLALFHE